MSSGSAFVMSGIRQLDVRIEKPAHEIVIGEPHVPSGVRGLQLGPDFVLDRLRDADIAGCPLKLPAADQFEMYDRENSSHAPVAVRREIVAAPELPLRNRGAPSWTR